MKRYPEKYSCSDCSARQLSIFHNFPANHLHDVDVDKSCFVMKRGEIIFNEGNLPHGIYCIRKGKIKIFKTGNEGRDQIVKFAKTGDVIGYRALLSGEKYSSSAACLEETQLCFIPKNSLLSLVAGHSCVAMNLMRFACHELGTSSRLITNMAQKSTRERLAEMLLVLKQNFGIDNDGALDVKLTREELGSLVGTATESVIRLLSDFKEEGLVELNGKKIIPKNISSLIKVGKVIDI
ncbi:MAG: Crp/Fnr family transcriptional regulator [Candidatus Competibacteraceae bacterium]|nr:Crp/Fnr family transcriptional regulator [Candidatus Competibacteraceae bacterium]